MDLARIGGSRGGVHRQGATVRYSVNESAADADAAAPKLEFQQRVLNLCVARRPTLLPLMNRRVNPGLPVPMGSRASSEFVMNASRHFSTPVDFAEDKEHFDEGETAVEDDARVESLSPVPGLQGALMRPSDLDTDLPERSWRHLSLREQGRMCLALGRSAYERSSTCAAIREGMGEYALTPLSPTA